MNLKLRFFGTAIIALIAVAFLYNSIDNDSVFRGNSKAIGGVFYKMQFKYKSPLKRNLGPKMSSAVDPETGHLLEEEKSGLFHLVTTFVPFDHEDVRKGLLIKGLSPTDEEIKARMAEVFECLKRNLENQLVSHVHVLVRRESTIRRLKMLDFKFIHKLVIHNNFASPSIKDNIDYAAKYLKGKTVMLLHQDNLLGPGFEKVNHTVLRKKKLMYALTRHPANCSASYASEHCGEGYRYVGSHDVFIFHVRGEFADDKLAELNVPPNTFGMENVLLWIFKKRLAYKVLNPCKVLKVYHQHCIPVRDNWRKRINRNGLNGGASFTDKLE
ncbi:uncharacterized protein LOC135695572 [Rhopilema esculentum]|uniref:uncharacterized protein LOC135695572 n=1 Tax=Rhopilema esculentum TaxID=499914 RepID=UPI0031CDB7E6|eukprot:gene11335-21524_t